MKPKDILSLVMLLVFVAGFLLALNDKIYDVPPPPVVDVVKPVNATLKTVATTRSGFHMKVEEAPDKEFDIIFITPDLVQNIGSLTAGTKLNLYIVPGELDKSHIKLWGVARTDDGVMLMDPEADVTKNVRIKFYTPPPRSHEVQHIAFGMMGAGILYFLGLGLFIFGRRFLSAPPSA